MKSAEISSKFRTALPSKPLWGFISHYWLSLDNTDIAHSVLPDGAIDLVINQSGTAAQSWAYGTSTSCSVVELEQNTHYLGVRFKPGQSRHFIKAAAKELTDYCEPTEGLLLFSFDGVLEDVARPDVFAQLDVIFENHVARSQPVSSRIDDAIALIRATHGTTKIEEAANTFGNSRRHFERLFLETVGVSPKLFSSITRFHHAAELIQGQLSTSLADVALASGYSDQSHMSHEFRRLANISPAMYARHHVAFLQDQAIQSSDNGHS